jgi:adenylate cyclase
VIGKRLPQISAKHAVTLIVFGVALLIALPLNWYWWRTARSSGLQLIDALSSQIAANAQKDFWSGVTAAETAYALTDLLIRPGAQVDDITNAISAGLTIGETPSAIAFDDPAIGRFTAVRDRAGNPMVKERSDSMAFEGLDRRSWLGPVADPAGEGRAVVFAGKAAAAAGSIAVFIGLDRFSALLGSLPVGRSGLAFVVDAGGATPIVPGGDARERLAPVIRSVAALVAARPPEAVNIVESRRLVSEGAGYRVFLSPLEFRGWQLAVVIPEEEHFGEINQMVRQALASLVTLALVLGLLASLFAQRIFSKPLGALVGDLARVQVFDLEAIAHRRLALKEFDELSGALSRMAKGLADFGKFIPTDLVRTLLTDGKRATPGGETRPVTVMFADAAGFTTLSERMGVAVIDIISRYLDIASRVVEANGGVVDKYIGDAVMALWGAPADDEEQALHACLAAREIVRAMREAGVADDRGEPLRIRIGISSGSAVVGNIGSARRLNYTAIGDTVNLASRLEGVNKRFGTEILIGETTQRAVGDRLPTREIAGIAVAGRAAGVRIFELLDGPAGSAKPAWALGYEAALAAYRARAFGEALALLAGVLQERPSDGPARWLEAECLTLQAAPPDGNWNAILTLDSK